MTTDTIKQNPCDRKTLFELAREIYALHCAIVQLSGIRSRHAYRDKLTEMLYERTNKFLSCGGLIETGTDILGDKYPILSYPDPKEKIEYNTGKLGCIQLMNYYPNQ